MTALLLRTLRLRHFRNFASLDLTFPAEGVAIIGDNGSGKTNLLESIYYLEIFRSFRGAPDDQLVGFGAEAFHVRAELAVASGQEGGELPAASAEARSDPTVSRASLEVTAAYEPRTRRKRVTLDGHEQERLGDAIGRVGVVIFSPSDLALVAGAPAERRRFLDIVLSLNVRGYLAVLQQYRQVLRQRNALLRRGSDGSALEPWDDALAHAGGRLAAYRAAWVEESRAAFTRTCEIVSGGTPSQLRYVPGFAAPDGLPDAETATAALAEALRRVSAREQERGATLAGPHRDDLAFLVCGPDGDVDLRGFGSGGQQRTAAIALRMVEAETVRRARGRPPLVLLDDVFAELDPGRSLRVLELIERDGRGQVILTAPKESDIALTTSAGQSFAAGLARWRIAAGSVST
jgi:DNA replication and repair protein RecF